MKFLKSQKNSDKNIKNFFKGFVWAGNGIKECFKRELNFRFHIFMTFAVFMVSYIFKIERSEFFILLFCILSVLVCELINTAIEEICDIIDQNYNEKIKYIKDLSAGMVLISAIISAIIGLFVFIPYLLKFINTVVLK